LELLPFPTSFERPASLLLAHGFYFLAVRQPDMTWSACYQPALRDNLLAPYYSQVVQLDDLPSWQAVEDFVWEAMEGG
jgi:hypothetical protein